jgi:hypothetical protein
MGLTNFGYTWEQAQRFIIMVKLQFVKIVSLLANVLLFTSACEGIIIINSKITFVNIYYVRRSRGIILGYYCIDEYKKM